MLLVTITAALLITTCPYDSFKWQKINKQQPINNKCIKQTVQAWTVLKLAVSSKNPTGGFAITRYLAFILSAINDRIDLSGTLDFSKNLEVHRTQSPGCHCLRQMETTAQITCHRVSSHVNASPQPPAGFSPNQHAWNACRLLGKRNVLVLVVDHES